jgi:hypothetical protein
LSIFTGVASFQGSMTDSDQNKYQTEGMQTLTDANAEYLSANQFILYDYTLYDSWYTTEDSAKAEYFPIQLLGGPANHPRQKRGRTFQRRILQRHADLG